jgi:UDP-N-acetylmuramate: L-alanyl-gamma-D-glutamyl-meso-diaminopimelate ligase
MSTPNTICLSPPSHIYLIGICGTGMGALAGLLCEAGFRVGGSDANAFPPMSTELKKLGVHIKEGFFASNLDDCPDLVVVGNVCKKDHVEAAAARDRNIPFASMARVLHDLFLVHKESLVISGTHGKTTTTALTAFLLTQVGRDPSLMVGGIAKDFGKGSRLGAGPEFVIEGDEYDSAYFEKYAKFLLYAPKAAVITSVEHDHIDIYPSFEVYRQAFADFAASVPFPGPIAVYGGDPIAVEAAKTSKARVIRYGVDGDASNDTLNWRAMPIGDGQFALFIDGRNEGVFQSALRGRHNLRNTLAAMILCHIKAEVPLASIKEALPKFQGVARRQQVIGCVRDIEVFDDFAHHPTAVLETLAAIRELHPRGRLLAAFEPKSATACRKLHQVAYASAFDAADKILFAPLGRDLPEHERLSTAQLVSDLRDRGKDALATSSIDEVKEEILKWVKPGDAVVLLSNGGFGNLRVELPAALACLAFS